jgi:hypothetical protein
MKFGVFVFCLWTYEYEDILCPCLIKLLGMIVFEGTEVELLAISSPALKIGVLGFKSRPLYLLYQLNRGLL